MIRLRRAGERGWTRLSWLDSAHSFSFGDYYDPGQMGFRALRVINEDRVAAGAGFGTHGHRDMEILTYVLSGQLQHRDSLGNGSVLGPGEVQRMTAGTGVRHSEFNPSATEAVHFLQIWLLPERPGLTPGYEQKAIAADEAGLVPVASSTGRAGSVTVHQDASVYLGRLNGDGVRHELRPGRHAWVQVVRGSVQLNGLSLAAGDGAALSEEPAVELRSDGAAEVVLFDLA
jgi:redox-sensitive bicupin YhaK (pirin superfamily)